MESATPPTQSTRATRRRSRRRSRSSTGAAARAGPPRTPSRRGAIGRCERRAAARREPRSWLVARRGIVEERQRLEAARAMQVAAIRGNHRARDPEPIALSEAFGLQHPMREYREPRFEVGGARFLPVDPQLARRHRAELLGEESAFARERLPRDLARRVARPIRTQHVEFLLARHPGAFPPHPARLRWRRSRERI